MRFMAIVAFCLMAILALVRNVDAVPSAAAHVSPAPPAEAPPHPRSTSARTVAAPAGPTRDPRPQAPAAVPSRDLRVVEPKPSGAPPGAKPAAPAAADASRGLTLRFASDQDFLRLVNRGDVRVYAFRDGEVLSVDADFRFRPAAAPQQLHEVLPETIPALMTAALRGAGRTAGYRWGITLPAALAREIRGYLDRGASGDLVIDRFGGVRLHAV